MKNLIVEDDPHVTNYVGSDQALDYPEGTFIEQVPDAPELAQIEQILKNFSNLIGGFCPGEISDIGEMLNRFDELIEISKEKDFDIFLEISIACKRYVENMTLENINNTKPIEEGLLLLRSILNHLKRREVFAFDYCEVLELLKIKFDDEKSVGNRQ